MNVFIRCEICVKKCPHRHGLNKTTGARVDGCIVDERKINKENEQ